MAQRTIVRTTGTVIMERGYFFVLRAIGAGLVRLVEATLRDQSTVLSVSSLTPDYYGLGDVCLSLPTVVDRGGVEQVLRLALSQDEIEGLRRSAEVLKATIAQLNL